MVDAAFVINSGLGTRTLETSVKSPKSGFSGLVRRILGQGPSRCVLIDESGDPPNVSLGCDLAATVVLSVGHEPLVLGFARKRKARCAMSVPM